MNQQKKLLAIDGGGIRGIMSLRVLKRIQEILRSQSGKNDLVLADYFDYIAGTSTGGIIAACLAKGMSVEEVESFYHEQASAMFTPTGNWIKRFSFAKYNPTKLQEKLQDVFGKETTLGSNDLKSLLMLVMLNATTSSPWPVSSNPKAKYNDRALSDESNLDLPLWQLVRASTAAPYYFDPETIMVGDNKFLFFDGGLTTLNNPAFKLFQMATLPGYRLEWPTGEDRMLLVSVGTGLLPKEVPKLNLLDKQPANLVNITLQSLLSSSTAEVDLQCRSFGKVLAGDPIDSEVGDFIGMPPLGAKPLFTYMRYNATLTPKGLQALGYEKSTSSKFALDDISSIDTCIEVGDLIAERQVKAEHFSEFPHVAKSMSTEKTAP
jgi:hypothetical protein